MTRDLQNSKWNDSLLKGNLTFGDIDAYLDSTAKKSTDSSSTQLMKGDTTWDALTTIMGQMKQSALELASNFVGETIKLANGMSIAVYDFIQDTCSNVQDFIRRTFSFRFLQMVSTILSSSGMSLAETYVLDLLKHSTIGSLMPASIVKYVVDSAWYALDRCMGMDEYRHSMLSAVNWQQPNGITRTAVLTTQAGTRITNALGYVGVRVFDSIVSTALDLEEWDPNSINDWLNEEQWAKWVAGWTSVQMAGEMAVVPGSNLSTTLRNLTMSDKSWYQYGLVYYTDVALQITQNNFERYIFNNKGVFYNVLDLVCDTSALWFQIHRKLHYVQVAYGLNQIKKINTDWIQASSQDRLQQDLEASDHKVQKVSIYSIGDYVSLDFLTFAAAYGLSKQMTRLSTIALDQLFSYSTDIYWAMFAGLASTLWMVLDAMLMAYSLCRDGKSLVASVYNGKDRGSKTYKFMITFSAGVLFPMIIPAGHVMNDVNMAGRLALGWGTIQNGVVTIASFCWARWNNIKNVIIKGFRLAVEREANHLYKIMQKPIDEMTQKRALLFSQLDLEGVSQIDEQINSSENLYKLFKSQITKEILKKSQSNIAVQVFHELKTWSMLHEIGDEPFQEWKSHEVGKLLLQS
jgi:hypothetical protein